MSDILMAQILLILKILDTVEILKTLEALKRLDSSEVGMIMWRRNFLALAVAVRRDREFISHVETFKEIVVEDYGGSAEDFFDWLCGSLVDFLKVVNEVLTESKKIVFFVGHVFEHFKGNFAFFGFFCY